MSNSPIRFKVCFKFIALLNFFILLTTSGASAVDVTIAWDANSESDLAGYILFYGTASRSYSNSIDVGNNTEYTLTGLNEGTTYYFSAKAYDTSNNESDYSKELVYTLPGANSAPNTPVQPTGPTSGFIQISYSFDTSGTDPDGDLLTYRFDWGDGNISAWGGAYSRTHAFSSVGTYCIKAQSQDTHSAVSAWSQCLNVDIDIQRHTISASAGPNGSISPSGSVTVNNGADQSFSIIPIQNYHVADVVVDGSSVGSVTSYTFNNVDGDHSIIASFTMDNQPPVANAGADKAVLVNDTVQLDGSNSSDANGDSLTYNWSFVSRPGGSNATLSNTQAVKPTFDVDVAGTYTVRLIVNDGTVDSAPDTVTISTENSKPVSNAGADQTVLVNDTVQLDGSSSSDVDGDSLTYKWSLVAKPGSSNAALSNTTVVKPTIDVDVAGSYTVQLIVNDGTVDSAPDTVMISTENSAPVAQAGADQAVQVNDTVQLDGSGSSDVDGHRLTFNWSLVTKPGGSAAALANPTAVKPTFNVDVTGTYTVQLIVNDGTVDSAPDTVTISTENSAPVANAGADQAVLVNDTVQLDGSGSSDADGDTLTLKWSFVSKPGGSSATMSDTTAVKPTFEVDVAGTYAVQLIVNDGTVDSAPDTVTISTENSAPVANAGADQTVLVNDTVQLDGSGSSDADGDTLTLKWSFVSKPGGSSASLSSTTAIKPTFEVDVAGSYTVQLIVNDGTDNSTPDTVTIGTTNSAPVSNAGADQIVEESTTVLLSGSGSTDPDQNIAGFAWEQTGGSAVTLSTPDKSETTFVAPQVLTNGEKLTFKLTVTDAGSLSDVDTCAVEITKPPAVDSDGDGVPDDQDAFPLDPNETMDTDGDGLGNNTDEDDDNDGMPDTWEISYGLNPLEDDAADDLDGDEISNINEYNLGSAPNFNEGNFKPDPPVLLVPESNATVGLTPLLRTDEFSDPNANDVHRKTHWMVIRAFDELCVFDVTSSVSLTSMTIPRQILEPNTEYIWKVRFVDNHDTPSDWSEEKEFSTVYAENDRNANGVPDDLEVSEYQDIDNDGTMDLAQNDIKCVNVEKQEGHVQICVSIRDAENANSIVSLDAEDPSDPQLVSKTHGKPNYIEFGLLDFKLLVDAPGDETTVTIYLSRPAYEEGNCFKFDPVDGVWLDYSGYTEFSPGRQQVYLTIKDGGFGDADGIANGIIVDPLAFGSETDPNGGSGSALDVLFEGVIPNDLSCFISATAGGITSYASGAAGCRSIILAFVIILLLPLVLYWFSRQLNRDRKSP